MLSGSRRGVGGYAKAVFLLVVLFCDADYRGGAVRILPEKKGVRSSTSSNEDLYRKFFGNATNQLKFNSSTTGDAGGGGDDGGGVFVDSKRRIPSCPDALHN
ncbi:hypothetical protein Droror1_Dr00022401 [Drosera rotundifolia]